MQKKAIKPDPKQQKAVKEYQVPKDIDQIKSFWSFNEIYKEFCSGAQPLTVLTKKDTEWIWGREQEEAFQLLKKLPYQAANSALSIFSRDFIIDMDASGFGVSSVLAQVQIVKGQEI